MKYIKVISILFIVLGFSVQIYGHTSEKPISLQIENLKRWKKSSEALAVQKSLGTVIKPRPNYPRSAGLRKEIKQYASIFKTPFLLLDAEPNDFGGFFALVVFKNHSKVFRIWIYEIDKNAFEVRDVMTLPVRLNKEILNELKDKRITPFWLTALAS